MGEMIECVVDSMVKDDVVVVASKTNIEGEIVEVVWLLVLCLKSGLYNLFKVFECYLKYGEVSVKLVEEMCKLVVEEFFARFI